MRLTKKDHEELRAASKPKRAASFAASGGSNATCQWVEDQDDEKLCGNPATHVVECGGKTYCPHHAKSFDGVEAIKPLSI